MKRIIKKLIIPAFIIGNILTSSNSNILNNDINKSNSRVNLKENNYSKSNFKSSLFHDSISISNYNISNEYNLEALESNIKSDSNQNIKIKYLNCCKDDDSLNLYSKDEIAYINYHFDKEIVSFGLELYLNFEKSESNTSRHYFYSFCVEQRTNKGWNSLLCESKTMYSGNYYALLSLKLDSPSNDIRISLIHDKNIEDKIFMKVKNVNYTYIDDNHVHLFDTYYRCNYKYHIVKCECGKSIKQAHIIKNSSLKYTNCIECGELIDLINQDKEFYILK